MKNILMALMFIIPFTALAQEVDSRAQNLAIANIMLDLPKVAAKIQAENLHLVDYSVVDLNNGVKKYTFKLARTCFCVPLTGTLKVTQDLRPTYADGAIKYTTKLTLDKP